MQTEREGAITIGLMVPIILETISRVERTKQFVPHLAQAWMEQEEALVVNDMTQSMVRLYNERHGPAELTRDTYGRPNL